MSRWFTNRLVLQLLRGATCGVMLAISVLHACGGNTLLAVAAASVVVLTLATAVGAAWRSRSES